MSWWQNIAEHLYSIRTQDDDRISIRLAITSAIIDSATDILYYILGFFSYLYFFSIAYLFFVKTIPHYDLLVRLVSAFSEPYLGAVGIYVILKEVRKSRGVRSRHKGEVFVFFWLALLIVSSGFVFLSPNFYIDDIMSRIITISLALLVIYIGGIIHKP